MERMSHLQPTLRFWALSCPRCISKLNNISVVNNPVFRQTWRYLSGTSYTTYRLKSRGVLQFQGPDSVQFLQGLLTNDITELKERKVQYNMLLNVQGRVMYDLLLYHVSTSDKSASDGASILMECQRDIVDKLLADIRKFKIRKKVNIEDRSEKLDVFAGFASEDSGAGSPNIPGVIVQSKDPRVPSFGDRIIVDRAASGAVTVTGDEFGYHERRYRYGIPEGTTDLPPGNCFPLESNLVYMNGVCFTKGCYLGQELTARTYHTGVTRKRLMPLQFDSDPKDLEPGENIKNEKGKSVGKFRNREGLFGLGLMRIGEIAGMLNVTNKSGEIVTVRAHKPNWWPQES